MDTNTNDVMEKIKALPSDATHFHLRGRTLGESLSAKVLEDIAKVIEQFGTATRVLDIDGDLKMISHDLQEKASCPPQSPGR
jgi:hypothetical protein